MFQPAVPHHDTGGFQSHRKFLPDDEYASALDCIVKACSDMLLLSPDGQRIFLGKRCVHPQVCAARSWSAQHARAPRAALLSQPDWWFVGGRVFPGETPIQSCCRLLKRELGLVIDPARFSTVCTQSLAWAMREQEPRQNGTTDLQVVLRLQYAVYQTSCVCGVVW